MSLCFGVSIWLPQIVTDELIDSQMHSVAGCPLNPPKTDWRYWQNSRSGQRVVIHAITDPTFLPPSLQAYIQEEVGILSGLVLGFDPPWDWPMEIIKSFVTSSGGLVTVREDDPVPHLYRLDNLSLLDQDEAFIHQSVTERD